MAPPRRWGFKPRPLVTHRYALRNIPGSINLVSEMPGSADGDAAASTAHTHALETLTQAMADLQRTLADFS
jgi:hypothetical protein